MKSERSQPARPASSRVGIAVGVIAVVLAALMMWNEADRGVGLDFYQFWMGGQAISRSDIENFYDQSTAAWIGGNYLEKARAEEPTELRTMAAEARVKPEFYSTPVLYAFFALFPERYGPAFYSYIAILLACLVGSIVLLGRSFGLTLPASLWIAAATLVAFEPFRAEIRVLNVNPLQLFAVALFLVLRQIPGPAWRVVGSAILAAAIVFKPNLALIVPISLIVLFAARRFRELIAEMAGYAIGAGLAFGAAAAHSGVGSWQRWWTAFRALPADIITVALGNISPRRFLDNAVPHAGAIVGIVLLLVTAALAFRAARAPERSETFAQLEHLTASLAVVLMFYLMSPMWIHYAVLALPLLVWLIAAPLPRDRALVRTAGIISAILVAFTPFMIVGAASNGARMASINLGLLIAVATALLVLWRAHGTLPVATRRRSS